MLLKINKKKCEVIKIIYFFDLKADICRINTYILMWRSIKKISNPYNFIGKN